MSCLSAHAMAQSNISLEVFIDEFMCKRRETEIARENERVGDRERERERVLTINNFYINCAKPS